MGGKETNERKRLRNSKREREREREGNYNEFSSRVTKD